MDESPRENTLTETKQALKSGTLGAFGAVALGSVMMAPALGVCANMGSGTGGLWQKFQRCGNDQLDLRPARPRPTCARAIYERSARKQINDCELGG
jgi:hypothetical protein